MIPPKEFIRKIRPFSFLSEDELNILMSGLAVELFGKDKLIYKKGQKWEYVYIIYSGLVGLFDDDLAVDYLSKGEVFGLIALHDSFILTARSIQETICYLIRKEDFESVSDVNERFSLFFSSFLGRRFHSFRSIATDKKLFEESTFTLNLEQLAHKEPVICNPNITIEEAILKMDLNRVSSIVVIDGNNKPIGILTNKDLRRVILEGNKSSKISDFMSSPLVEIPLNTTIFDALVKMMEAGIDHMAITKHGQLHGVITRNDIQAQLEPSSSIVALFRKIVKATSVAELENIFQSMKFAIAKIALGDPNYYDLTGTISSMHDAIVIKVIEMAGKNHSRNDFTWLHMGSSGRKEEIIATDQDNAMIHSVNNDWVEFGNEITETLQRIGIPKCPGNYMASNEKWNRSLSVWKNYFQEWFVDPVPDHVRYLSIFLDIRPVYGDINIYRELVRAISSNVTDRAIKVLAHDAIQIEPPLGIFGIRGIHKGIDLKMIGIYPIVNGVRVLATDNGIFEITNTKERLKALCDKGVVSKDMSRDLIESYGFLQRLRLQHHAVAALNQRVEDNVINAGELQKVDLLLLKESLKIVRTFQKFLGKRYNVVRDAIFG